MTKILIDRAVVEQALDALIWTTGSEDFSEGGLAREGALKLLFPTIAALRERLGEGAEPRNQCGETCERAKLCAVCAGGLVEQGPLTREEIFDLAEPFGEFQYGDAQGHKRTDFANAIIAAYERKNGIGD